MMNFLLQVDAVEAEEEEVEDEMEAGEAEEEAVEEELEAVEAAGRGLRLPSWSAMEKISTLKANRKWPGST